MMKGQIKMYYFSDLCIEVTRKCNMGCEHCLRGEAENIDIDLKYIDALLANCAGIGTITFTGGEPSLNTKAIDYTLRKCEEFGIDVESFYIVTNGKDNVLPLATSCLKWYAHCYEKDMCGLALSKDMFHEDIDSYNEELLRGLAFFREDKFTDWNRTILISTGRATELSGFKMRPNRAAPFEAEIDVGMNGSKSGTIYSMFYLSANGDIRTDCNSSYEDPAYTIGNLNDGDLNDIIAAQIAEKA